MERFAGPVTAGLVSSPTVVPFAARDVCRKDERPRHGLHVPRRHDGIPRPVGHAAPTPPRPEPADAARPAGRPRPDAGHAGFHPPLAHPVEAVGGVPHRASPGRASGGQPGAAPGVPLHPPYTSDVRHPPSSLCRSIRRPIPPRLRLLLADDEPPVQDLLRATLGEACALSVACSVEEALACLAADRPDAVLADYLLPDGPTLPVLREADRLGVPVAVMTGHPAVIELLDGATWPMLRKPFGMAELRLALQTLLGMPAPVRPAVASRLARLARPCRPAPTPERIAGGRPGWKGE